MARPMWSSVLADCRSRNAVIRIGTMWRYGWAAGISAETRDWSLVIDRWPLINLLVPRSNADLRPQRLQQALRLPDVGLLLNSVVSDLAFDRQRACVAE